MNFVQYDNDVILPIKILFNNVPFDLTGSTVLVTIKLPNLKDIISKDGIIVNAKTGEVEVNLKSADLYYSGNYYYQATVITPTGLEFSNNSQQFNVSSKLDGNLLGVPTYDIPANLKGPKGDPGPQGPPGDSVDLSLINEQIQVVENKIKEVADSIGTGGGSGILTRSLENGEGVLILNGTGGETNPPPTTIAVTNIVASSNYIAVNKGETRQIAYTIYPENATNKTITFTSSNQAIATVSNSGIITTKAAGSALITLTASNGVTTDCEVVVSEVSNVIVVTGINLNSNTLELTVGETKTLTATITPNNATNKSIVWESSDQTIATVTNGVVTPIKSGTVTITCTSVENSTIKATCTITISVKTTLTSVTNGLIHSYDFTNLSGTGTNIADLTGTTPMIMAGFTDVSTSKSQYGITKQANTSYISLGNISSEAINAFTVGVTFKGTTAQWLGVFGTSGVKMNASNNAAGVGDGMFTITDGAYFAGSFWANETSNDIFTNVITSFDFANRLVKVWVGGILALSKAMNDKIIWSNTINLFESFSANANPITMKNCVMYKKVITNEEAVQISKDLMSIKYLNIDSTKSYIQTAKKDIAIHYSNKNTTLENNTIKDLVSAKTMPNVASLTTDGFISSSTSSVVKDIPYSRDTTIIKYKWDASNANKGNLFLFNNSNGFQMYIDSTSNKLNAKTSTVWLVNGVAITQKTDNIIMIERKQFATEGENAAWTTNFYFNGVLIGTSTNSAIGKFTVDTLANIVIPIEDYIVFGRTLSDSEKSSLFNELGVTV